MTSIPGQPTDAARQPGPAGPAVLEFCVKRLMGGAPLVGVLPGLLRRLVTAFGCQSAAVFHLEHDQLPLRSACYPAGSVTAALVDELRAASAAHPVALASGGSFTAKVAGGRTNSQVRALVAVSAPWAGEHLVAIALIGRRARWDASARSLLRTLASVLAGEISRSGMASLLAGAHLPEHDDAAFQVLSRLAPVGIVLFDASGQCTFVNDRWCAWTGIAREHALGAGWSEAIHPDDVARVEAEAIAALDQGTEVRTDCRLAGSKGRERWISAVVSPVLDHDHQVAGYLAAATDVSERKERAAERERLLAGERRAHQSAESARRELASHIDRLRELDELKSQFLAMVSHELRTPLSSVISFAGLIAAREESLSDESADYLRIIERNAEHLLHLVGDLMLLGGLETGVVSLQFDSVSVPGLVGDAVETGSAEAARRGVSLVGAAQSGPPARGDRLRLTQVMDNLVSNAVKFTGDGGHVTVSATCDQRQWRIDVQDEGIGIPAGELDRLFGRFFRASNAVRSGTPGTGVGLAIVKTIIELHGGQVEVRSAVGHGTTFSVFIPVQRQEGRRR